MDPRLPVPPARHPVLALQLVSAGPHALHMAGPVTSSTGDIAHFLALGHKRMCLIVYALRAELVVRLGSWIPSATAPASI
jgi:hypothetical protein